MALFNFFKKLTRRKKSKIKKPVKNPKKRVRPAKAKAAKGRLKKTKKKTQKTFKRPLQKIAIAAKEKQIGIITHYFNKISVGIIKLKTAVSLGDKIHIKGAHDDFTQGIESMQIDHQDVSTAPKGAEIGIKVSQRVHENDRVYLSSEK